MSLLGITPTVTHYYKTEYSALPFNESYSIFHITYKELKQTRFETRKALNRKENRTAFKREISLIPSFPLFVLQVPDNAICFATRNERFNESYRIGQNFPGFVQTIKPNIKRIKFVWTRL